MGLLQRLIGRASASRLAPTSAAPEGDKLFDLLGRPAVNLDTPELQRFIGGRRILVTGAGGSIGSEICRQIMKYCPRSLVMVDRCENALFEIDQQLRHRWIGAPLVAAVGDITDSKRIETLFTQHRPQVVFHAAAHKHVPMMEQNPGEAVKNNVIGTRTVADIALLSNVQAFVLISTDKAVNPTSVMGATKRLAELYVQSLNDSFDSSDSIQKNHPAARSDRPTTPVRMADDRPATRFVAVRFGNVIGSSGSVIPTFKKQIQAGGPVTVTHPDMRRYFMTIPEASQLVMQAGAIGRGGEIFVLDMGEPVKIIDIARAMIRQHGLTIGTDIDLKIVGVRPGEKLFEELAGDTDATVSTGHKKIKIWKLPRLSRDDVLRRIEALTRSIDFDRSAVLEALAMAVPDYTPDLPNRQSTSSQQAGEAA